jgi:hypothetical protein
VASDDQRDGDVEIELMPLKEMDYDAYREYRAELDNVLLNGSPKKLKRFMRKHGIEPPRDEVLEITFHKTITATTTLPLHYRKRSKAWLDAHNYRSLDDGDL